LHFDPAHHSHTRSHLPEQRTLTAHHLIYPVCQSYKPDFDLLEQHSTQLDLLISITSVNNTQPTTITTAMSRNYSVTEPHPSVPQSGTFVLGSGIGGAGNYKRYTNTELTSGPSAQGPPSRITLNRAPSSQRSTVRVGRGGAGNYVAKTPEAEQAMFQFDEEMHARRDQAPVYHIGRGGAANFVNAKPSPQRVSSDASSVSSGSSAGSARRSIEGAIGKFTRKLSSRS
jgi:hypothetical protein